MLDTHIVSISQTGKPRRREAKSLFQVTQRVSGGAGTCTLWPGRTATCHRHLSGESAAWSGMALSKVSTMDVRGGRETTGLWPQTSLPQNPALTFPRLPVPLAIPSPRLIRLFPTSPGFLLLITLAPGNTTSVLQVGSCLSGSGPCLVLGPRSVFHKCGQRPFRSIVN